MPRACAALRCPRTGAPSVLTWLVAICAVLAAATAAAAQMPPLPHSSYRAVWSGLQETFLNVVDEAGPRNFYYKRTGELEEARDVENQCSYSSTLSRSADVDSTKPLRIGDPYGPFTWANWKIWEIVNQDNARTCHVVSGHNSTYGADPCFDEYDTTCYGVPNLGVLSFFVRMQRASQCKGEFFDDDDVDLRCDVTEMQGTPFFGGETRSRSFGGRYVQEGSAPYYYSRRIEVNGTFVWYKDNNVPVSFTASVEDARSGPTYDVRSTTRATLQLVDYRKRAGDIACNPPPLPAECGDDDDDEDFSLQEERVRDFAKEPLQAHRSLLFDMMPFARRTTENG